VAGDHEICCMMDGILIGLKPPVPTAREEEAVCLDPVADCFYLSINRATFSQ